MNRTPTAFDFSCKFCGRRMNFRVTGNGPKDAHGICREKDAERKRKMVARMPGYSRAEIY